MSERILEDRVKSWLLDVGENIQLSNVKLKVFKDKSILMTVFYIVK